MRISAINSQNFNSIKEEYRRPPVEVEQRQLQPTPKQESFNPISATGWLGAGGIAVSVVSGFANMPGLHKISALIGGASVITHIGLVNRHIFSEKNKNMIG